MKQRIIATFAVLLAIGATTMGPISARSADMAMGDATSWLNGPPQTAGDLRGKVVIVQFWTYTCVNWRRTLRYVRAWPAKYRGLGGRDPYRLPRRHRQSARDLGCIPQRLLACALPSRCSRTYPLPAVRR